MSPTDTRLRIRLVTGAVLGYLAAGGRVYLGSLDVPIEPSSWREIIALYSLSSLITAALLVFGLILTRSIVRLWTERGRQQLGARFKTKMVLGAMAISLLAGHIHVLRQLFIIEPHARPVVPSTIGNCFRRNAEAAQRFRAKAHCHDCMRRVIKPQCTFRRLRNRFWPTHCPVDWMLSGYTTRRVISCGRSNLRRSARGSRSCDMHGGRRAGGIGAPTAKRRGDLGSGR